MGDKTIWDGYSLEFQAMHSLVPIIKDSLVSSRSGYGSHCSINKPETVI